ncbi:SDR family NAD(P)-dependent oxidoreductase [Alteriqipengyuania lutimaris]|uniref:SDR family NAD(P)-dependent oxidoreductase n=1 Tax=Alteriqipengyuania lutimaris TaxID=1538146 RepID=A0A395LNN5_9SPHN|nr:SDR family NAD(P)-dependent oxidoreductase [Alteriqipengyuania lutimaris]
MDRAMIVGASGGIGSALVEGLMERGAKTVFAASRTRPERLPTGAQWVRFDLDKEGSIAAAAQAAGAQPLDCVIVASGVLTLPDGNGPERSYRQIDAEAMARVFHLNTIGPALVAKHFLPLLPRDRRAVFAALSARVGSIGDNGIGGWHSYRASKAALNMLVRNFAIELGRTHQEAVCVALHPGTVNTPLSEPFQANLPEGQLTAPAEAASNLLDVLDGLTPDDSGYMFDWAGKRVRF